MDHSVSLNDQWLSFLQKEKQTHTTLNLNNTLNDQTSCTINHTNTPSPKNCIHIPSDYNHKNYNSSNKNLIIPPTPSDLYISTKTKIIHLNVPINLLDIFWNIPIQDYFIMKEGIIKKQIKLSLYDKQAVYDVDHLIQLEKEKNYHVHVKIISHIETPNTFKNVRKVNIGLCKKDILASNKYQQKGAFYNCIVLTIRVFVDQQFHDIHMKIFNSGKLEIPGIKNDNVLHSIIHFFQQICNNFNIIFKDLSTLNFETILINSNFKCKYNINRDKLFHVLKQTYGLQCTYDPCSYPGIRCRFYYYKPHSSHINDENQNINGQKRNYSKQTETQYVVSFMIFRTGSILIVGKCTETIIQKIYSFLSNIFQEQYHLVKSSNPNLDQNTHIHHKSHKKKKLFIHISS